MNLWFASIVLRVKYLMQCIPFCTSFFPISLFLSLSLSLSLSHTLYFFVFNNLNTLQDNWKYVELRLEVRGGKVIDEDHEYQSCFSVLSHYLYCCVARFFLCQH